MKLPEIEIGDELLVGKWKNRKAIVQGFGTNEHGQPTVQTDKGEYDVFKFRVSKLMKGESMSKAKNLINSLASPAAETKPVVEKANFETPAAIMQKATDVWLFIKDLLKAGGAETDAGSLEVNDEAAKWLNKAADHMEHVRNELVDAFDAMGGKEKGW